MQTDPFILFKQSYIDRFICGINNCPPNKYLFNKSLQKKQELEHWIFLHPLYTFYLEFKDIYAKPPYIIGINHILIDKLKCTIDKFYHFNEVSDLYYCITNDKKEECYRLGYRSITSKYIQNTFFTIKINDTFAIVSTFILNKCHKIMFMNPWSCCISDGDNNDGSGNIDNDEIIPDSYTGLKIRVNLNLFDEHYIVYIIPDYGICIMDANECWRLQVDNPAKITIYNIPKK